MGIESIWQGTEHTVLMCSCADGYCGGSILLICTDWRLPMIKSRTHLHRDQQRRPSSLSLMINLEGMMVLNAKLYVMHISLTHVYLFSTGPVQSAESAGSYPMSICCGSR